MKFLAVRMGWRQGLAVVCGCMAGWMVATAQTVHVDVTPGHAVAFDPDKALGTSMDILPAKDFEKVYSEPVIKAGLSRISNDCHARASSQALPSAMNG